MKTPEVGATDRVCQCVALWGSRTKTRAATTTRSRGELADKGSSDATQFAARCKRRTRRMEMRQQSTELRRQSTRQKHLRNTVHAGGWRQRAGRAGDRGRLASVSDTSHLNTLKYNKSISIIIFFLYLIKYFLYFVFFKLIPGLKTMKSTSCIDLDKFKVFLFLNLFLKSALSSQSK